MRTWKARIAALEEHLGSIEAVCAALHVAFATVFRWKAGRSAPSPMAQEKIVALEAKVAAKKEKVK